MDRLILVVDNGENDVKRECQWCGYQLGDPYNHLGQVPITCSTCDAQHGRDYALGKLADEHHPESPLLPAQCNCKKSLKDCLCFLDRCGQPRKGQLALF